MSRSSHRDQPDMFASLDDESRPARYVYEDYMLEIRRPQLQAQLKQVREATTFPWKNLTDALLAEETFNGMAFNFPPKEGRAAMIAYAKEISRLYALIEEPWTPMIYSCPGRWL